MKRFAFPWRHGVNLALLMCLFVASPGLVWAQAPVKIRQYQGAVDLSTTPPTLTMEGQASHLGRFMAKGQVLFAPGADPGTIVGSGPVVFRAANGDLLVGTMIWTVSAATGDSREANVHFRWSDSVTLSDGAIVTNTGRFVTERPAGLIITASWQELIYLILFGPGTKPR